MSTDVATARARLLDIVRAKAIVHGKVTLEYGLIPSLQAPLWKWLESAPESPLDGGEYPRLLIPDNHAIAPTPLQW